MLCVLSLSLMVSVVGHNKGTKEVGMFWNLVHICPCFLYDVSGTVKWHFKGLDMHVSFFKNVLGFVYLFTKIPVMDTC